MVQPKVGLYLRLSKEDNKYQSESESIRNQRDLLVSVAEQRGWRVSEIYKDDGFTGSNYDRPDFERLIRDVESGKINIIITKDMSRLGRDQSETMRLLKKYFPHKRVLYIAHLDHIETMTGMDMRIGVNAFLNEMKVTQTSENTKAAKKTKAERGEFANSQAPYGFIKDPNNKNRLVPDEYTREIVHRIFVLYSEGYSGRSIANILNTEGVLSPSRYHNLQNNKPETAKEAAVTWGSATVMSILRRKVYIGHMVSGMRTNITPLLHDRVCVPEEDWICVKDTHEPIIEKELWDKVQSIASRNEKHGRVGRSTNNNGEISLFKSKVFCASCGKQMNCTTNRTESKAYVKYRCSTYSNCGKAACSYNAISEEDLHQVVLNDIQEVIRLLVRDEEALLNRMLELSSTVRENSVDVLKKQADRLVNEICDKERVCMKLLEDRTKGLISDTMMKHFMSQYEKELEDKNKELLLWRNKLTETENKTDNTKNIIEKFRSHVHIQALDRTIVTEMIDKIIVSKVSGEGSEKVRNIEIYYNFVGKILSKPESA